MTLGINATCDKNHLMDLLSNIPEEITLTEENHFINLQIKGNLCIDPTNNRIFLRITKMKKTKEFMK